VVGTAAKRAEESATKKDQEKYLRQQTLHDEAMVYAESLIEETLNSSNQKSANNKNFNISDELPSVSADYSVLTEVGKTEVALVIVLYNYINRIISAILGEQMSTAMFIEPNSTDEKMESTSIMGVINKVMAPFLAGGLKTKHKPGITASLFPSGSSCLNFVPEHLKGAELAGEHCMEALARLVAWTEVYERDHTNGAVSPEVIAFLDDPANTPPPRMRTHQIAQWATVSMRDEIKKLHHKSNRNVASILLLVSYSPQSVYNSVHWKSLVKELGPDKAKTIVIWWSLRFTFQRSKGLRLSGDKDHKKVR